MDPLSIGVSVLTVIGATIASVKALSETVDRYKGRDKTLGRLQGGLLDLIAILNSLEAAADGETPVLTLLKGPVDRCAQVCREFEEAMKIFNGKSKTGLKDWARMEFMRGDINEFIDALADYKSTIAIGLGTITMQSSKITEKFVGEYNEMIKDTAYNLEVRLQRIDEKLTSIATDRASLSEDSSIDLQDEKAVTVQCLSICERASTYIKSLQDEQPALQREAPQQGVAYVLNQFDAEILTQKSLKENRENLRKTMDRIQERLDSISLNGGADGKSEILRLQEELNQCLEVCKMGTNQVYEKIHIIGEVVSEEDCDQVVVTTVADLFNVAKVNTIKRSMQLAGSMEGIVFSSVSKDRYNSRYGSVNYRFETAQLDTAAASPSTFETRMADRSSTKSNQAKEDGKLAGPDATYDRPSPNEVRRRRADGEDGKK